MLRRLLVLTSALAPILLVLGGCPSGDDQPTDAGVADAAEAEAAPPLDGPSPSPCATGYLGDVNAPAIIELRALKADGTDVPINDGDDLAVLFPPQGGRVAFVGIHATNLDGCGMQITGVLRDPITKQIRLDGRTVNLRRDQPEGWGTTGRGTTTNVADSAEIGDYSNIPLCPNQWAEQDLFDVGFELEVIVVDRLKKTVSKKINVIPRCAESGERLAACRCLCKKGYVLGESCGEDAGVDSGQ